MLKFHVMLKEFNESAQKVDHGEENSAGTRTWDLSITSPAL